MFAYFASGDLQGEASNTVGRGPGTEKAREPIHRNANRKIADVPLTTQVTPVNVNGAGPASEPSEDRALRSLAFAHSSERDVHQRLDRCP